MLLNPVDSLPRVDISVPVSKLLPKLSDGNWKVRKEGLDGLELLLTQSNNRIKIDYDLITALKTRINDPNKSLAKGFLTFSGRFVVACGKDIKPHCKAMLASVIGNLSDKQNLVRNEANIAIEKFSSIVGKDSIINSMQEFLNNESIEMKINILSYIIGNLEDFKKSELKGYIGPIL